MSRKSLLLCLLGTAFLCLLIAGAVKLLYGGYELPLAVHVFPGAVADTAVSAVPAVPAAAPPAVALKPSKPETFNRTVRLLGKDYVLNQTEDHVLHACDSSGKPLWDASLDGRIDGTVGIVDFYSNGKEQFMFTVGNKLYVVDRLGRFVEGFPMKLIPLE